jgi:hypothetical protein
MGVGIKSYIDDLFKYLDIYETNYVEFKTEAFLQTYNGIYAVFQALRKQRDNAVDVDQYFLQKIKQSPVSSSDLRQLSIQVMITYFESEADTDGQSNKSYLYCRDLRPVKRDASFFEEYLVPILFREGSLNNNLRLNAFFLDEIGRFINKFAKTLNADISPEEFESFSDPVKFLELARRKLELGNELLRDRNSLEFHLMGIGSFEKLASRGKTYDYYLKEWSYLVKISLWSKLKDFFSVLWSGIKDLFTSFNYFRLSLTQRRAAYLFYGLIIVLFIFLAIYIPVKWQSYSSNKLRSLEQRAITTQKAIGK